MNKNLVSISLVLAILGSLFLFFSYRYKIFETYIDYASEYKGHLDEQKREKREIAGQKSRAAAIETRKKLRIMAEQMAEQHLHNIKGFNPLDARNYAYIFGPEESIRRNMNFIGWDVCKNTLLEANEHIMTNRIEHYTSSEHILKDKCFQIEHLNFIDYTGKSRHTTRVHVYFNKNQKVEKVDVNIWPKTILSR